MCVYYLIRGKWSGLKASYNSTLPLSLRWMRPPKPATGTERSRFSVRSLKPAQKEMEGKVVSFVHDYPFDFTGFWFQMVWQAKKILVSFPLSHSLLELKHKSLTPFKKKKAEKRCFGEWIKTLGDRNVFTHNFIKDCSEAKASGWIHVIMFQLRSLKHLKKQSKNGWKESSRCLMWEKKTSSQNFIKF